MLYILSEMLVVIGDSTLVSLIELLDCPVDDKEGW